MQEQLELLNQISDELNKDLILDKMLQRVLDLTVAHFKAKSGSIMLFDEENRVSKFILQRQNISDDRAQRIVGRVLTEGFAGWVIKNKRGDVIMDTQDDPRWYTFPNQPYTVRSVIATPLTRRKRILGVLTINHDQPNRFEKQNLFLVNAIAGQAAIALENAQLFRQTELERAKLSAIINGTQDAIVVTYQEDNSVLLMNPAAEKILQVKPNSWQDKPFNEISYLTGLVAMLTSDPLTGGELQLPDERTMSVSVIDIPDVGRLALMHDISALKALDKLKTEFVTTFTHDLAAPLAAIKRYLQLIQIDGDVTERQEEDIGFIRLLVNQMRTLIVDLLELSKIESIKHLVTCEISLQETLEKTFKSFQPMVATKEIDFVLENYPEPIVIQGNPTLIGRAIDNLVENAIKYNKAQGKITLSLSQHNNEAHIGVKDTGIGIPANKLPNVFNRFFRAHAPSDNELPGSGLGLSIVKTIVEQHGGRIWVESEKKQGSTFTIALPLDGVETEANGL